MFLGKSIKASLSRLSTSETIGLIIIGTLITSPLIMGLVWLIDEMYPGDLGLRGRVGIFLTILAILIVSVLIESRARRK